MNKLQMEYDETSLGESKQFGEKLLAHEPVLLDDVLAICCANRTSATKQKLLDCTFGAGGHSRALLSAGFAHLDAVDRDPVALKFAKELASEFPGRVDTFNENFSSYLEDHLNMGKYRYDAILIDLGVSSMQLDDRARGFSFSQDGPLDMRMSQTGVSAADLVNRKSADELTHIFKRLGEEPRARQAARAICERREVTPFTTTLDLANVASKSLGYPRYGPQASTRHPATRIFQALRIAINDELHEVEKALDLATELLAPSGVLAVISFHSLEDRIVKQCFTMLVEGPKSNRHLPGEPLKTDYVFAVSKKAITASSAETARNSRSRSARLRAIIRAPNRPTPRGKSASTEHTQS